MAFVLVVDDNKAASDAMVDMLKALGVDARAAYGPHDALQILAKLKPGLIFLDMNMPGLDGVEILGYIRRDLKLSEVPVVVATSDDQVSTHHRALAAGANRVLVKPVMLDVMMEILQEYGLLP